jgi:excisionase family DNA binding protein
MQVRQAARYPGVHENTLRRWEENGLVRAVRLPSGVRRFHVDEVERLRAEIYGGAGSESSRSYPRLPRLRGKASRRGLTAG